MKINSPEHFLELKDKDAIFYIDKKYGDFISNNLQSIEDIWDNKWKLNFIDSSQDLQTWNNIENPYSKIVDKDKLSVWYLKHEDIQNWAIPIVFNGKDFCPEQFKKLNQKMYIVWSEIDYLREDFITWKSIKFDMWKDDKILQNILFLFHRAFSNRISVWLYKILESPISNRNTSLADILDSIKKLNILDDGSLVKLNCDLQVCKNFQKNIGSHSRNNLFWHMDFKKHLELISANELTWTISHRSVVISRDWLKCIDDIKEIHKYWFEYIFRLYFPPQVSTSFNPSKLDEYEYNFFLTVKNKKTWEVIEFDN